MKQFVEIYVEHTGRVLNIIAELDDENACIKRIKTLPEDTGLWSSMDSFFYSENWIKRKLTPEKDPEYFL